MYYRIFASLLVALSLSACAGGNSDPLGGNFRAPAERRALDPIGDPGNVAASDIGYSRMVREDGAGAAFDRYAASGAVLHLAGGPVAAKQAFANESAGERIARRGPKAVWSSCDGSLAVSTGRFARADGLVGNYTTVWELQRDGDYRWTYELRETDDPQPPPPAPGAQYDDDTIVVTELTSIQGRVADCARRGEAAPAYEGALSGANASGRSRDGTLVWQWSGANGTGRRVLTEWLREGEWQTAHDYAARP